MVGTIEEAVEKAAEGRRLGRRRWPFQRPSRSKSSPPTGSSSPNRWTRCRCPGAEGYFGVLPGHAPLLASLHVGRDVVPQGPGEALPGHRLRLRRGAAGQGHRARAASPNASEDIDMARAEAAMARAEQRIGEPRSRHRLRARPHRDDEVADPAAGGVAGPDAGARVERAARPEGRADMILPRRHVLANLRQVFPLPRAHLQPRRARTEGALPRVGARLPLDVRQPAAAAPGSTRSSSGGDAGARAAPALEPYALFLFCGILPWTWFSVVAARELHRADRPAGTCIRKVMFPGRDPAHRHRAHRARELRVRPAHPGGVPRYYAGVRCCTAIWLWLPVDRPGAADAHARPGAAALVPHRCTFATSVICWAT